jgi:uridine phosphorylase
MNILGAEMEASIIFVLTRVWGLRAGGISVVFDNVLHVSGETGKFDPGKDIEHNDGSIEKLARMGSEIVRILWERDGEQ